MKRLIASLSLVIAGLGIPVHSAQFQEVNGVVAMEAEHATNISGWQQVTIADACGTTMEDRGNGTGYMDFDITFSKIGTYIVWTKHEKKTTSEGCGASDECNDCEAYMDGQRLMLYPKSNCTGSLAVPEGFGTHYTTLTWQSRPKTECVGDRTQDGQPELAFSIATTGRHTFRVGSRSAKSQGYRLDKMIFKHVEDGGLTRPTGCANAETILDQTAARSHGVQPSIDRIRAADGFRDLVHVYDVKGARMFSGTVNQWNGVCKALPCGQGVRVVRFARGDAARYVQ